MPSSYNEAEKRKRELWDRQRQSQPMMDHTSIQSVAGSENIYPECDAQAGCGSPMKCLSTATCRGSSVDVKQPIDPNYEGPMYEKPEEIDRPKHYARFPIEPVTFIMMNDLPFWAANVVKYACRAPFKHAEEDADLDKIIRYAQMRKEQLKREREGDRAVVWNPL